MPIAQRISVTGTIKRNRKLIKIPSTGFIRLKINEEFIYNIDPQHLQIVIDFINAVGYIFISIYPSEYYKGKPYKYCVAVSKGLYKPCEIWYITINAKGIPEAEACITDKLTVKSIHLKILHLQFFHMYNEGYPLILPPLYSNAHRHEIKNIDITLPTQLKEFYEIEN